MEIRQIKLERMAVFSYLLGDEATRTCALIDPAFETSKILQVAADAGYRVTHVINTHGHCDHTAGNAAIIAATGARLLIHRLDAKRLESWFTRMFSRVLGGKGSPRADILLEDQSQIQIGRTALSVLHTPGHTEGGVCIYSDGHVFTGDTLFVGTVGRTDFPGGSAPQLLQSIREKIYTLPDTTRIWPGHDYGSFPHSTVQNEKATNLFTVTSG